MFEDNYSNLGYSFNHLIFYFIKDIFKILFLDSSISKCQLVKFSSFKNRLFYTAYNKGYTVNFINYLSSF